MGYVSKAFSCLALLAAAVDMLLAQQSICTNMPSRCSCVLSSAAGADAGKSIDLVSVGNVEGSTPRFNVIGSDGHNYFYNPCNDASIPNTECSSMAACQLWEGLYIPIGYNSFADFRQDSRGKYLWYRGEQYGSGTYRETYVYLVCDPSLDPRLTSEGDLQTPYVYVMELSSKFACPQSSTPVEPTETSGSSSGLTVGTYMCIAALVIIVVYIGAGVGYKAGYKGARGAEMMPNLDFWKSLPGLIKDGGLFIREKVAGLRGGTSEKEYEKL